MNDATKLAFVILSLFALVVGTWCGAVAVMIRTYEECATAGTKTYENFILTKPLVIKCSVSKG